MEKLIYHFHPETGEFIGIGVADQDPLDESNWLVPANATEIEPPGHDPAKRLVFSGSEWQLIAAVAPAADIPPEEIQAQTIRDYENALDAHLDSVAQAYRYRDRFAFAMRAAYPGPWRAEGTAFGEWMDKCNMQALTLLNAVVAGAAALPTKEAFIASLPIFELPS